MADSALGFYGRNNHVALAILWPTSRPPIAANGVHLGQCDFGPYCGPQPSFRWALGYCLKQESLVLVALFWFPNQSA